MPIFLYLKPYHLYFWEKIFLSFAVTSYHCHFHHVPESNLRALPILSCPRILISHIFVFKYMMNGLIEDIFLRCRKYKHQFKGNSFTNLLNLWKVWLRWTRTSSLSVTKTTDVVDKIDDNDDSRLQEKVTPLNMDCQHWHMNDGWIIVLMRN